MRRTCPHSIALGLLFTAALVQLSVRAAEPLSPSSPTLPAAPNNALSISQAEARVNAAERSGDFFALVPALNAQADALIRAGQFDAAERLRLRVLHLQEEHAGRDSVEVSDALLNLGWFDINLARYEAAQEVLDRCEGIRQRKLGPNAAPTAEVLNALGALEENRGNLDLAQAFYEQAIAIQEKVFGPGSAVTANTTNNLATVDWIMGDYASAQRLYAEALAVREKTLGPGSAVVAKTLTNLALLDISLGDYDEAEAYFQRALAIRMAQLGPDNPATLTTLSQLAELYLREGDDARAEPLLLRAVAGQPAATPVDDSDVARTLEELALLDDRRHDFAQAGPLHRRALEIRRRLLGPQHPDVAASLAALARHEHAQGSLAAALPLYQEALKIDTEALGADHPETMAVTADLALLDIELCRPDDATRLAHDLADGQRALLNGVFTFAPEHQRIGLERTIEPCDLPAALADADLLAEAVLRTKGVVLDSLLEDAALSRAARDPAVSDLLERRRQLVAQLGISPDDASGGPAAPMSVGERGQLEQEERQVEADLAARGLGGGETRRALATDLSDVRDAIPDDAALVEFVAYQRYTGRLTSAPWYGAIVLARNRVAQWVPLGPAPEIEARVHLAQKYMRKRVRDAAVREVLRGLYDTLCAPVLAHAPPTIHRLILSPDGQLNFVSFATLLDPDDQFLGSRFDVGYVASGRDLLRHPPLPPRARQLVVFANPDYNRLPGDDPAPPVHARAAAREDELLAPLPGTEHEAQLVVAEAKRAGLDAQLFTGAVASEPNLAKVEAPFILHLATHGLYLPADEVPNLPADGDTPMPTAAQPMTRSVLALAGGSVTLRDWRKKLFPPGASDGLLTAQQAAALNLDGTWLVVLSACDTGAGEAESGEGVFGLRRGFAEAGAQNLLMTLWPADDAETAALMPAFYREALRTGDAATALARVQRAELEALRRRDGLSEAVRKAGPFILGF
jgi:CHAT domain-containing protein/tetratricopeptide (TPR) repeat protein